ncbi:MAG TPA: HAD family hydrolase [Solirubrobacteraceae bacterium]|jgi:putative hydrolase of the HAD superfamily|nr:HAD family hydrolase [Solirubrobacteraceae bacterium]
MPRRAILFDLDGTLMDHDAARESGLVAHLAQWLPEAEPEDLARLNGEWRRLEALHYDEYTAGLCSFTEQRRRRVQGLHASLGRTGPSEVEADAWFARYLQRYRSAWRPFDDVSPMLVALASSHGEAVLGVVTNGEGGPQRAKLAAIGLAESFSVVVASGEVGLAKPDPAIFALACERLGVKPEQAAHVGDRLDLDARAAASAGLLGVWLDRPGASNRESMMMTATPSTSMQEPGVSRIATLEELPGALGL